MTEPPQSLLTTIRIIDRFTDTTGFIIALLAVPLVGAVAFEVVSRYVFHAPENRFLLGEIFYEDKGNNRLDFLHRLLLPGAGDPRLHRLRRGDLLLQPR